MIYFGLVKYLKFEFNFRNCNNVNFFESYSLIRLKKLVGCMHKYSIKKNNIVVARKRGDK